MRIKRFQVSGFKAEQRAANLIFADGPTSVMYGPNGVGKTTMLQIMSSFFSQSESILLANKVQRIDCTLVGEIEKSEYHVYAESNGESGYEWHIEEYPEFDKLRSLSIGVERGIAPQNLSVNPEIIFDFLYRYSKNSRRGFRGTHDYRPSEIARDSGFRDDMRNLSSELAYFLRRRSRNSSRQREIDFDVAHLNLKSIKMENIEDILSDQYREARYKTTKNIQAALFDTIATLVENPELNRSDEQSTPEFLASLKKYQSRIESALSGPDENAFMSMVRNTLDLYCSDDAQVTPDDNPILINMFRNMIRELEVEDESLDGVNVIVSAFNDQLEFGKKLVVESSRSAYIEIDEERHGLGELSSGERHILTFLTLISTAGRGRDFIFIDEPEISLNLKWQREVLGLLQGILPDCQIIAASHSPAISQNPNTLCKLEVGGSLVDR
ncbi:AAA family ATPase [Pseudophaeobacter sp.]|uniref:AAA family ATPase n=1 Tax=Pseudophaeobacter sp. TaxID=1971739 RepID=UPI003A97E3EA